MNDVRGANRPDMSAFWMPFTANRRFKADPRMLVAAKGMYYRTDDGREVMDGCAGLWCVNAGHGRPEIAEAVGRQLEAMDYAPSFQLGHPLAFDFAAELAKIAPAGPNGALDRIFFAGSGSEAVDTALKIAQAYHKARGEGGRTRLIGRERGYHGVGFGGISVGGLVNNRRAFTLLPGVDHMRHTLDLERNAFSRGLPEHGAELADDLERIVALHGADTIAAVIVEPVAGSAGVLPPPKGYLERLRAICDKHGILLIFDEVITGFGRTGQAFASQVVGVTPDLMSTAKGLTNAAFPMGAVFAGRHVHDAIVQGPPHLIELFHGYTYSGHPAACAAGLAALDIYQREGLFTRAAEMSRVWEDALHGLKGARHVIDLRNFGLMAAVDLEPRAGAPGMRGYEAMLKGLEAGLLMRFTGDTLAFSPPLIISEAEIGFLFDTVREVVESLD